MYRGSCPGYLKELPLYAHRRATCLEWFSRDFGHSTPARGFGEPQMELVIIAVRGKWQSLRVSRSPKVPMLIRAHKARITLNFGWQVSGEWAENSPIICIPSSSRRDVTCGNFITAVFFAQVPAWHFCNAFFMCGGGLSRLPHTGPRNFMRC